MKLLALALLLAAAPLRAEPSAPFPFMPPWDDASPGVTDLSGLLEKPAGLHGFVTARGGHLYAGEKRIRFFGVNMAFGANFPSHEDAPKIAARMAKFGINCVRFHHMDNQSAPSGIWSAGSRSPSSPEKTAACCTWTARTGHSGTRWRSGNKPSPPQADGVFGKDQRSASIPAWGNAPGNRVDNGQGLKQLC